MPPSNQNKTNPGAVAAAGQTEDSAGQFVAKFASHYKNCVSLAKRFTVDNPDLEEDSAAISHLCRASQEMLEQAKEARALTEIYLALDEQHRDAVRAIMTARFKDISKLARASLLRFRDSVKLAQTTKRAIEAAQQEFEPHANEFREALRAFIAMSAKTR
jgi:hypothetical protein